MKKLYLFILLIFISSDSFPQSVQVTERLANKMNSLNPLQYTRVLILMKDRVDIEELDKGLYETDAAIEYRAQLVINTLREKAKQTQGPILNYLIAEKESGKIKQMINYWITNLIFIEATPDVINSLTMRNDIEIMDLDAELETDKPFNERPAPDNSESVESGLKTIRADSLWMIGITGAGRTVMNIDGGVNGTHPALSSRWWGNNGRQWYHSWFDPIAPVSSSPFDCAAGEIYHGTHTMGIMCGRNSATGDTIGVAPDAYWMAAGVTDCPDASYPSMNIAAYQWAMDPDTNAATMNMPDVINCSWRDPTAFDECTSSIYRATLTAVEAAGIAVVFSAGNSGPFTSTITPPKNINMDSVNVFCVGSVNGTSLEISSFSSRGPSLCGGTGTLLIKPEVCAPGENIRSAWSGSSYEYLWGTSMAAPHVAGCIALLKQAAPGMTGKQLKAILFSTATDLGTAGEDNSYGKGLINVYRAYQMLSQIISSPPCEDFTSLTFPPYPLTVEYTGTNYWTRNNVSAYGTGSGSAKFDFYSTSGGEDQSLVSNNFTNTGANTYLTFDQAYAPFGEAGYGPDTLLVETSNDLGATYTELAVLLGTFEGTGELNTAPPSFSPYVPQNTEWRPKIYSLPAGTNKVRLQAKSGYGNNLYVDNLCVQTLDAPVSNFVGITPQGFYRGSPNIFSGIPDEVRLYLHRVDLPNIIVDSATVNIDASTSTYPVFSKALSGSYYIVVRHRNSIETWSNAGGITYSRGASFYFDFLQVNTAYNNYQYLVNPVSNLWGMFGGDIEQNGFVDLNDVTSVYNDATAFAAGYIVTDVTGDNAADLNDIILTYNNNTNFVSVQKPAGSEPEPVPYIQLSDDKIPVFENDAQRYKYENAKRMMNEMKDKKTEDVKPNWGVKPPEGYQNRNNNYHKSYNNNSRRSVVK